MSSGAKAQVARLLALVPYLNSHPEVALERAATDFGVPPAQIVRDLKVLWYCGLPGLGPGELIDIDMDALEQEGGGVIRLSNAEYLSRPLRLGSSEAAALVVALRAMREGSPTESREAIDRTLAKLEDASVAGSSAADVVEVSSHTAQTAQARARLEEAIEGSRQVRLAYYVPARDETTERVVDPLALLEAEGNSYLDAWCHLAEARRLFRLDRVFGLEILSEPVLPHDIPARDLSAGLFEPGPGDVLATLRLHRVARWVAEYYPVESQSELPDSGLEVTLRVSDPRWLVRLLMRLAPYADLVAPVDLTEQVQTSARAALSNYS